MKRRILSAILAALLCMALLPTTVLAAGTTPRITAIGGKENLNISTSQSDSGWSYDAASRTLTLKGYNGGRIEVVGDQRQNFTVKLVGNNTIHSTSYGLTIDSEDSSYPDTPTNYLNFTITADNDATLAVNGIHIVRRVNFAIGGNATVQSVTTAENIPALKGGGSGAGNCSVTIKENANVTLQSGIDQSGNSFCLVPITGNLTVNTTGDVNIDATKTGGAAIQLYGSVHTSLNSVNQMKIKWSKGGYNLKLNKDGYATNTGDGIAIYRTGAYASVQFANSSGTLGYSVTGSTGKSYGDFMKDDIVTITAKTPETGKQFKNWTWVCKGVDNLEFTDNTTANDANATIKIPDPEKITKDFTGFRYLTFTANYENIPVTGVTLNKDTLELFYGASELLTAAVTPDNAGDKSVTWTSSDPGVATVDENGNVTATGVGTATITATTTDGDKTAACTVTVTKSITDDTITVESIPSQTYTGNEITPEITVKDGDKTLMKGTDYSVQYSDNTNAGTATVTIDGVDKYTNRCTVQFTINKAIPIYTAPTNLTATYGQTLQDVTLPAGWSWMSETQSVGNVTTPATTFKAKFTPDDTTNYNIVENIDVPVTVYAREEASVTAPEIHAFAGETKEIDLSRYKKNDTDTMGSAHCVDQGEIFQTPPYHVQNSDKVGFVIKDDAKIGNTETVTAGVTSTDGNTWYEIQFTVKVVRKPSGTVVTPTYPPTISDADNGDITVSPISPKSGDTVTIIPKPDDGYTVDTVTVTASNGNKITVTDNGNCTYKFTQPSSKVTIAVTFKEIGCPKNETCPISKFADASVTAWYHDGVHYCLEEGLMSGHANGTFEPNGPLTRAQLAQILYNKTGKPTITKMSTFTDVAPDKWYAKAIAWAQQNGVVSGIGNHQFAPEQTVTREEMAAMLYRNAGSPAVTGTITGFTDAANISEWAVDAILWATRNGVINGDRQSDGRLKLKAKDGATRAETATMLENYYNK